jgi:hypothetical protein
MEGSESEEIAGDETECRAKVIPRPVKTKESRDQERSMQPTKSPM